MNIPPRDVVSAELPPPRDVPLIDITVDLSPRDVVFSEVIRVDTPQVDTPQVDTPQVDTPQVDTPQVDTPPADITPVDVPVGACTTRLSPQEPACPGEVCGNNRVDTCRRCGPCGPFPGGPGGRDGGGPPGPPPPPPWDAGTCCTDSAEACDGTALGGRTCASLGYSGGTIRCGPSCSFDTGDCDVCATGPSIVRCGRTRVSAGNPQQLALATTLATDEPVAIAWADYLAPDGVGGALGFAVLSAGLEVVRTNPCMGSGFTHVALAATPRGWLLAAQNSAGVNLYPLGPGGVAIGSVRTIPRGSYPILASSPDGRTLLVYVNSESRISAVSSVVLNPDAGAASGTATLLSTVVEPEYGSAVYARNGWLVAMRDRGVVIIPVANDGSAGAAVHPTTNETEYPQVGYNGSAATLTWSDFGGAGSVRFSSLDAAGHLTGPTVNLGSIPLYYNVSPTARVGADTVVLMSGYTGGTGRARRLDLQRVSSAGVASGSMTALTTGPESHMNYRIAPIGSDVVAAWLPVNGAPGRITVARVHP